jgi:hypothetical protein
VDPSGAILSALTRLARDAGIEVRVEPFGLKLAGKGGLCRVDGRLVILVDAALAPIEQIGVVGPALGRALPRGTKVPEGLASYLTTGHGHVGRLARLRPLARGRGP